MDSSDDPAREGTARAAARDVTAGAMLAVVGLVCGGSAVSAGHDRLDVVFDGLAAVWIVWGLGRLFSLKARRAEPVELPAAVALGALSVLGIVALVRLLG